MSTINVTNLKGRGGASPNLPDGAVVTGVATATTFSGTLDGSLKTTGTPTLGLGVTINSSGINVSGVLTATTFKGDGSNLTGVGETIAPWNYNPDVGDTAVTVGTGIGITFNKAVSSGSGTATLKIVNAGAAGTTIQSWGVSSCTFNANILTMGALVSDLIINKTYQLDIPSGFIVDSNETSYAGTAYTFTAESAAQNLWVWGANSDGQLGLSQASNVKTSSPVQVPGINWGDFGGDGGPNDVSTHNVKQDGTWWAFGKNDAGQLGQNGTTQRSSPVQVGSGTDWSTVSQGYHCSYGIKTDGTLWVVGRNDYGQLGANSRTYLSSPTQIPGTTWSSVSGGRLWALAVKTNGTLWGMGRNNKGQLGLNSTTTYSSPTQIPGTTWRSATGSGSSYYHSLATKTDGTLWSWGENTKGQLGTNQAAPTNVSSPIQIPGTNWSSLVVAGRQMTTASKTDGTLWSWGYNIYGVVGDNSTVNKSSPVQIPGTSWGTNQSYFKSGAYFSLALRTDNTMWGWGLNEGHLAQNNRTQYSSPVQIPGNGRWLSIQTVANMGAAVQEDTTP